MKITKFDRPTVKGFSQAAMKALEVLATEYGVKLNYKGGSFSDTSFTFKVEAAVVGEGGQVLSRERGEYVLNAQWLGVGLTGKEIDAEIKIRGQKFFVHGMSPRSNKILIRDEAGKVYKIKAEAVARALGVYSAPTPRVATGLLQSPPTA